MERISTLLAGHGVVAGQVLLTPYDFLHRTQYVHARETFSAIARPRRRSGGERERHGRRRRDPVRRQRPHRRAGGEPDPCRRARHAHRHRRTLHRRPAARRWRVADRADRRGRRGARRRGRWRRIRTWERRHGHEARRGPDRRLVGGAGRDRRGRRAGNRDRCDRRTRGRDRGRGPPRTAHEPQALDRVRRRCRRSDRGRRRRGGAPSSPTDDPCWPPVSAASRATSMRRARWRWPTRRGACSPRAWSRWTAPPRWAAAGRRTADLPAGTPTEVIHRDDLVVLE